MKDIWLVKKPCSTDLQRFFSGTSIGRKPRKMRMNRLTQFT